MADIVRASAEEPPMSPLKKARTARGWTQSQLAKAAGISQSRVARLEQFGGGSPATAARIAAEFGGQITELQILYPDRYQAAPAGAANEPQEAPA